MKIVLTKEHPIGGRLKSKGTIVEGTRGFCNELILQKIAKPWPIVIEEKIEKVIKKKRR